MACAHSLEVMLAMAPIPPMAHMQATVANAREEEVKARQEEHHRHYHGSHEYYAHECPKCEAFKKRAEQLKQILLNNRQLAFPTCLSLTIQEASALRHACSLDLVCSECEENEAVMQWYESAYNTREQSMSSA